MSDPITDLETFKLFIDGKTVDAISGRIFKSINPYTGQPWAIIADGGPEDIDVAVASARAAFNGEWGRKTGFERAAIMRGIAQAPSGWPCSRCATRAS